MRTLNSRWVSQQSFLSRRHVDELESSLAMQFCASYGRRYWLIMPWAVVLSAAMWAVIPPGRILAWFFALVVSQAVCHILCSTIERPRPGEHGSVPWTWGLSASVIGDSLVAGSAGMILFPAASMPHQFTLALFLCFVAGATAVTYAAHLPSCLASVFAILLPLSGTLILQDTGCSAAVGGAVVMLGLAFCVAAIHINKALIGSLTLSIEKDKLIGDLSTGMKKIEDLNVELQEESLERMLLFDSLRRSEDRYRALVEAQTEVVCRMFGDYRISFMNEAGRRYFGILPQDVIGRNFLELVHAEDRDAAQEFLEEVCRRAMSRTHEHRVINMDGDVRTMQWTFLMMHDESEQLNEIQAVGRDITAQRRAEEALQRSHEELEQRVQERTSELQAMNRRLQIEISDRIKIEKALRDSEERFRTIFERARDCIFVKDPQLRYSHVNPAMQAVFESPESDLIGLTDVDLYGSDQAGRLRHEDLRVLAGQVIEAEHSLILKGRELTFNCVKVPMLNSTGEIRGLCGIARDVTERLLTRVKRSKNPSEIRSDAMRQTMSQVGLASRNDSLVLLLGESGSGKDYLARFLHDSSLRSGGPFFAINCAALAPSLAESELFGHEAGAFTGARSRKRGMLELAEGGTLLLNEIGELSATLQAKLLTFLDTRSFTRVGGQATIEVNARLIAATNRDLGKEVQAGQFRLDLYHRLNVFSVRVPPLRERLEDLPLLIHTILEDLSAKLGHAEVPGLDSRCVSILTAYHWPGNVRELRNVLERSLILSQGKKIVPDAIRLLEPHSLPPEHEEWRYVVHFPTGSKNLNIVSKQVKSALIKEALRRSSGVKNEAARLLGVSIDSFKHHFRSTEA